MAKLESLLSLFKGGGLLAVFPHPDDESFVAGGLFQLTQKLGVTTELICLSRGEKGPRELELKKACKILAIDKVNLWDYPEGQLKNNVAAWLPRVRDVITKSKPHFVLTFDPSGITGHPDHIVTSLEIFEEIKSLKGTKPKLLWRVPDSIEKNYFKENSALSAAEVPTHAYNLSFGQSVKKIEAIFSHESQMKSLFFKLQILEWYLFDHKEPYHLVDLKAERRHKFIFKKS